jgi:predicted MFS family arabinose efflux permease
LKDLVGFSPASANAVSAIPFGLSAILMWLIARSSDRTGERKRHACFPMLAAAFFSLMTLVPAQPVLLRLTWTSLAGAFVFAWIPGFWAMPAAIASGSARAAALGLINSVGNLGGFVGPALIGELLAHTHSQAALGLLVASSYCTAAALVAFVRIKPAA